MNNDYFGDCIFMLFHGPAVIFEFFSMIPDHEGIVIMIDNDYIILVHFHYILDLRIKSFQSIDYITSMSIPQVNSLV